jgi:2-dehydro-3-deoxy-D-arabinonate dehydratase
MVPEPELTLAITRSGKIVGYTIGNDLSCRDIEGENPLYLPQAKTFDRCAAVGPGILVSADPISPDAEIRLEITRDGQTVFSGATAVSQMKKTLPALASYLYRDNTFPHGALLMTGTGIVPDDNFTLASGDQIRIAIAGIGALVNGVE